MAVGILRQKGCDYESRWEDAIYGKKQVILFAIALIGGYDFCLGTIWNLFLGRRRNIAEDKIVIFMNDNSCLSETSDRPGNIECCPYERGYVVNVTHREGTQPITRNQKKA